MRRRDDANVMMLDHIQADTVLSLSTSLGVEGLHGAVVDTLVSGSPFSPSRNICRAKLDKDLSWVMTRRGLPRGLTG